MRVLLIVAIIASSYGVMAQTQLSLENLDDFKPQAGNWQIVGDVSMNRNVDVHHKPAPEESKKKKKKKKGAVEAPKAVDFTSGTGILLNINDGQKKDHIITNFEHGDIELELDVMLPKGSNSGIYLQGRYELQLFDSWGSKNPKYSDIGGIYRNWEKEPGKILVGIPPASNASKAPGLWQNLKLHFQAPVFDRSGNKIKNARFVYVELNGVRIHTNVDVALPTGGPIANNEVAMGPIMIQGDHGPVAIRNFKYKALKDLDAKISGLSYKTYLGEYKGIEEFEGQPAVASGSAKLIDVSATGEEDNYAIVYTGVLNIPESAEYLLSVGYTGGARLVVDNKTVVENLSSGAQGTLNEKVNLSSGSHPFTIYNYKSAGWRAPRLGFFIKGDDTNPVSFHHFNSFPDTPSGVSPILVDVAAQPKLHRGFVTFEKTGEKLSHTIGVGSPDGVHYIYDLNAANVIGVWRGDFIDATPMWHNRGNATFVPRGAVQWTFLNQPLVQLATPNSPFPDKADFSDFKPKGYAIDESTGTPVFKHEYKGVEVENRVQPDATGTYLIHEITLSQTSPAGWYYKLAEGNIRKMSDGSFAINDQQYYVNVLSGQQAQIRTVNGVQELVVAVSGSSIKYEIIW